MTDNDRAKRHVLILGTAGGGKTVVLRSPVLDAIAQSMPVFAPRRMCSTPMRAYVKPSRPKID